MTELINIDGGLSKGTEKQIKPGRNNTLVSFAQFRPEKEHLMQLEIWKNVLNDERIPNDCKFIMIGTVRGADDQMIVDNIKKKLENQEFLTKLIFK